MAPASATQGCGYSCRKPATCKRGGLRGWANNWQRPHMLSTGKRAHTQAHRHAHARARTHTHAHIQRGFPLSTTALQFSSTPPPVSCVHQCPECEFHDQAPPHLSVWPAGQPSASAVRCCPALQHIAGGCSGRRLAHSHAHLLLHRTQQDGKAMACRPGAGQTLHNAVKHWSNPSHDVVTCGHRFTSKEVVDSNTQACKPSLTRRKHQARHLGPKS